MLADPPAKNRSTEEYGSLLYMVYDIRCSTRQPLFSTSPARRWLPTHEPKHFAVKLFDIKRVLVIDGYLPHVCIPSSKRDVPLKKKTLQGITAQKTVTLSLYLALCSYWH